MRNQSRQDELAKDWRALPIFHNLTKTELALVESQLRHRQFEAGQEILRMGGYGPDVLFVLKGHVTISTPGEEGAQTALHILGPNEVLGEIRALDGGPHSARVLAHDAVCCATLEVPTFIRLLWEIPQLSRNLNLILTQRLRRLTGTLQARDQLDLKQRVMRQLYVLAREHGPVKQNNALLGAIPKEQGRSILIPLRLTQTELACLVGGTRGRVNSILKDLESQRIIRLLSHHRIEVLDLEILSQLCQ